MRRGAAGVALALALVAAPATRAQSLDPAGLAACAAMENDAQRLTCYDTLAAHRTETAPAAPVTRAVERPEAHPARDDPPAARSLLDSRWELDPAHKLGTLNLRGYQPIYIAPVFVSSRMNQLPASANPDNTTTTPLGLKKQEAKFQISFKTKLVEGLIAGHGDLWGAYTQTSYWQVWNPALSRPFRETNYEPEAMLVFDADIPVGSWRLRMLGAGLSHQSNGRSEPLSRSWNRVIGWIGMERPGWTLIWRPWWRLPETRRRDDNPDIMRYLGHGEVRVVHVRGSQELSLMLRQNFRTGRGAQRLAWGFPIGAGLRGHVELFNGWGESLIDYNHRSTAIGLGVRLLDWY